MGPKDAASPQGSQPFGRVGSELDSRQLFLAFLSTLAVCGFGSIVGELPFAGADPLVCKIHGSVEAQ